MAQEVISKKIRIMKCPFCGTFLEEKDNGLFWQCSFCEGECWPPEKDDTPAKLGKAARAAHVEDIRTGFHGCPKGGGGSKSKGRKKPVKFDRNRFRNF